MTENEHALHRYFIWADRMRFHFDQELGKRGQSVPSTDPPTIEEFMYMSMWYAQLYAVVEGWRELKLRDRKVDGLLDQSEHIELLRRYRNGVNHFQKDYFDLRFTEFVAKENSAAWVRTLNKALSDYFLSR